VKHVYLDHNIVIQLVERPEAAEHEAAAEIVKSENASFAVSLWNLVEAASGNQKDQAIKLGSFLDNIKPLWLLDRFSLERGEIKDFVYRSCYGIESGALKVFHQYLSQVVSYLGAEVITVGESGAAFVANLLDTPDAMPLIRRAYHETSSALRVLQGVKKSRNLTTELKHEIFTKWISGLLPSKDPDNRAVDNETQEIFLLYCTEKNVVQACPAIAVEHHLFDFRISDPNRKPEEQDAPDLAHVVPALAHCDVFVTREGYLRSASQYVKKHCPFETAVSVECLAEALAVL
jgi:hypothetical protein